MKKSNYTYSNVNVLTSENPLTLPKYEDSCETES